MVANVAMSAAKAMRSSAAWPSPAGFRRAGVRHLGALGSLGHLPLKLLDASLLLGEKRLVAPLRVHCLRLFRLRDPFLAARLRCDLFLVVDAMVVSVHVGLPFD